MFKRRLIKSCFFSLYLVDIFTKTKEDNFTSREVETEENLINLNIPEVFSEVQDIFNRFRYILKVFHDQISLSHLFTFRQ